MSIAYLHDLSLSQSHIHNVANDKPSFFLGICQFFPWSWSMEVKELELDGARLFQTTIQETLLLTSGGY